MAESKPPPILKVNDTFSSYEDLRKAIDRYEKVNRVQFWTRDAKKLHRASPTVYEIVKDYPELEYCSLRLACIHGGKPFQPKNKFKEPKRKSRGTWKQDCKAEIFVKLSDDKRSLVVHRLEEEHNHAIPSSEVFKQFPKARRISGKRRITQKFLLESKLKERINNDCGIKLENIVKANSLARSNNFRKLADVLREKYNCGVELQTDASDRAYGFFFQDNLMQKHFDLFPEILSIDGTFTLQNINCRVYIFTVENSLGSGHIVGVGVLTDFTPPSLDWLFERFKNRSEKWEEISILMTDRQTSEDKIGERHFPNARRFICLSHASYIFKKEITSIKEIEVAPSELEDFLNYFEKLMRAKDHTEYNIILEDMEDNTSAVLMEYFHKKWEGLKNEWVKNMFDYISNYVAISSEDPNSKFRSAISSTKTFSTFIEKFFLMLYLKRSEFQGEFSKTFKILYMEASETERQYQKVLTSFAFEKIKPIINLVERNEPKFEYKIEDDDVLCIYGDVAYVVSEISCVCDFFTLMRLPCEHILFYREKENMNLFDECLFSQRWTREYAQNLFVEEKTTPKEENEEEDEKNADEKYREAEQICKELATLCCEVRSNEFEERMDVLRQLRRSWENEDKVTIHTVEYVKDNVSEIILEIEEPEDYNDSVETS